MTAKQKYRVLIAKPGLGGHDRVAKFITRPEKNQQQCPLISHATTT